MVEGLLREQLSTEISILTASLEACNGSQPRLLSNRKGMMEFRLTWLQRPKTVYAVVYYAKMNNNFRRKNTYY